MARKMQATGSGSMLQGNAKLMNLWRDCGVGGRDWQNRSNNYRQSNQEILRMLNRSVVALMSGVLDFQSGRKQVECGGMLCRWQYIRPAKRTTGATYTYLLCGLGMKCQHTWRKSSTVISIRPPKTRLDTMRERIRRSAQSKALKFNCHIRHQI